MRALEGRGCGPGGVPAVAVAMFALIYGCGGPSQQATPPPQASRASPPLPALQTLPPAPAQWVLVARPSALWASATTRRIAHAVLPSARLDTLETRNGVDVRQLETAVLAGYEPGVLLLGKGPFDAAFVVRELAARMTPEELALDRPFLRRTGYLGRARRTIAALGEHTLAGTDGAHAAFEDMLRRAASARQAPPSALSMSDVEPLVERYRDRPLVLYVPEPLDLPLGSDVGLLLARQRSLAVVARPERDTVHFEIDLRGEFPPDAMDNFQRLFESIATSDLGLAFGLDAALTNLRIHTAPGQVSMRFRIPASKLARGAGLLLGGNPWPWLTGEAAGFPPPEHPAPTQSP